GIPANAPNIEGWLFPATYTFDPGVTPHDAIKTLVDTMIQKLDEAGVPAESRFTVLTLASIVQRESGPNVADMAK
ncbi:endolytic transglycosylase MltG, partial [Schumannella luteola]